MPFTAQELKDLRNARETARAAYYTAMDASGMDYLLLNTPQDAETLALAHGYIDEYLAYMSAVNAYAYARQTATHQGD